MGQIKLPNFARPGSREGAALVAEQLVFHQALGDGGTIQRDKGMIAALRQMMNCASEKLLPGAAFAEEQNGGIRDGNALNLLAGFTDGGVFSDDARKPVACGVFLAQEQVLAKQFLLAGCALDKQLQVIEIDWLLKKIECAFRSMPRSSLLSSTRSKGSIQIVSTTNRTGSTEKAQDVCGEGKHVS